MAPQRVARDGSDGPAKRVGVGELKNQLSKYLRAAEGGVELVVTRRHRPIARIVGVTAGPGVEARPARTRFTCVRTRPYPAARWPRSSTDLLLEERQGR